MAVTIEKVAENVEDLASVMLDIAKSQNALRQLVAKAFMDEDDEYEEEESIDKMPEDEVLEEEVFEEETPVEGIEPEDEYVEEEDVEMMGDHKRDWSKQKKSVKKAKGVKKGVKKGYAGRAKPTADEEDAPFGEQQDNVEGNEESPAGEMGGDREDETFNMKFSALKDEIKALRKALTDSGITVAKAVVPHPGAVTRKRALAGEGEGVITRDTQEQVKKRSFRDINRLREDMGDLPRHGISG